jgi:hypothetical protein
LICRQIKLKAFICGSRLETFSEYNFGQTKIMFNNPDRLSIFALKSQKASSFFHKVAQADVLGFVR